MIAPKVVKVYQVPFSDQKLEETYRQLGFQPNDLGMDLQIGGIQIKVVNIPGWELHFGSTASHLEPIASSKTARPNALLPIRSHA